ncbi:MAG: class I SAM-dependent methyltransferase [Actinomycetota bacterium]|nr:class I SAM-dependent methyltransferase [Actinomycetota bacterium]
MDEGGLADHRRRLLEGLSGEVIEIGAGNGLNFCHYPPEASRVVAVEPDPCLRDVAKKNLASAVVLIRVVDGVAEQLPVPDSTFDTAVVSLVLCSVVDQMGPL